MGRILIYAIGGVLVAALAFWFARGMNRVSPEERAPAEGEDETGVIISNMEISSNAFTDGATIPVKYTCDGANISPPLTIIGVPEGAKSLALITEDPDVPKSIRADGMWYHWLVWNIPVGTGELTEGSVPPGTQGKNSGGQTGYSGPCPPDREHRYFFKLYALDAELNLPSGADREVLDRAMAGHILAETQLMGRYNRQP